MALILLLFALDPSAARAAKFRPNPNPTAGDGMFERYFEQQTRKLADRSLADIKTLDDWTKQRKVYRRQLYEMLGLAPLPPKTDLKVTVTGTIDHPEFTVQNLHYQSMPGLYVTGNLYLPKGLTKPAPAILYVCGHGKVKIDGVSYGNKTHYQHHGSWFARNGFVCLTIDTVQMGEIEGIHHGTYREGMWWWNSRGYSSAGAEGWNCIRALDLLQSRPEVDPDRLGVTGRSGGGAYSWWVATLDERIKAAAPVAGITDLHNHVVDGVVEGHCDCMYMVNTYQWDYAHLAAMVAPRPLLICNTDDDRIFPLDGVHRLFQKTRRIYELHDAKDKLGLVIIPGGHRDTQPLRVPVFDWFNKHLKGEQPPITMAADKLFEPGQLKVFSDLPADERTSNIHDSFTRLAKTDSGASAGTILTALKDKTFRAWPHEAPPAAVREIAKTERDGIELSVIEFTTQDPFRIRAYIAKPIGRKLKGLHLEVIEQSQWPQQLAIATAGFAPAFKEEFALAGINPNAPVPASMRDTFSKWIRYIKDNQSAYVTLTVRGVGNTVIRDDERHQIQTRRRFMLLGQTLAGMQVYDILRTIDALRLSKELQDLPLHLWGSGSMANNVLLASLFAKDVQQLHLSNLATDDKQAPDYLNLSRVVTWPDLIRIARENTTVQISQPKSKRP